MEREQRLSAEHLQTRTGSKMKRKYTVTRKLAGGASATAIFNAQRDAFHFISDLLANGVTEITLKSTPA